MRHANTAPKKDIHEPPGSRGGFWEGVSGQLWRSTQQKLFSCFAAREISIKKRRNLKRNKHSSRERLPRAARAPAGRSAPRAIFLKKCSQDKLYLRLVCKIDVEKTSEKQGTIPKSRQKPGAIACFKAKEMN